MVERPVGGQSHQMLLLKPKAEAYQKTAAECWEGPWGHFPCLCPLSASTRHRRDNEILILSDRGPPRQDHVT